MDKHLGEFIQFVDTGEIHSSYTADAKGILLWKIWPLLWLQCAFILEE